MPHPASAPLPPLPSALLGTWLFLATQLVAFAVLTGTVLVLRIGQGLASAFDGAPHWGVMMAPAPALMLSGSAILLAVRTGPWRTRGALAVALAAGALVAAAPTFTLWGTIAPTEPALTSFCRRVAVGFFFVHGAVMLSIVTAVWLRGRAPVTAALAWYSAFVAAMWPAVAVAAYL